MRRTLIAIAATVALAACGGGDGDDAATGTTEAEPTGTTAEAPAETAGATALDGTWAATGISTEEIATTLDAEGFGDEELEIFLDEMGVTETMDLTWKVQAGQYTLDGVADGDTEIGRIDAADLETAGDTVTFAYYSGGSSTLRWPIEGDRLELELLEDVQQDYRGIPTAVFVAGLYGSATWERVAP
jgi:hypothetical protein